MDFQRTSPQVVDQLILRIAEIPWLKLVRMGGPKTLTWVDLQFPVRSRIPDCPDAEVDLHVWIDRGGCYVGFYSNPPNMDTETIQAIQSILEQAGHPCVLEEEWSGVHGKPIPWVFFE